MRAMKQLTVNYKDEAAIVHRVRECLINLIAIGFSVSQITADAARLRNHTEFRRGHLTHALIVQLELYLFDDGNERNCLTQSVSLLLLFNR